MKIYIDQGHNPQYSDVGIEENGYREQDLTYEIGVQLDSILRANGFETRLSRPLNDTLLGSSKSSSGSLRVEDANNWGADYFISLHTGFSNDPFATGSSAVVLKSTSDAIPIAESILDELTLLTKQQNRGVVSKTDYSMLRKAKMPSLVIELGFITNKNDANLMGKNPTIYAQGIANGIISYLKENNGVNSLATATIIPFYQLYPENCKRKCILYVEVYTERVIQVPVPKAGITVYNAIDGKCIVIYRGQTDYLGRSIPIELPLYDEETFGSHPPYIFKIAVHHPDFLPKSLWLEINDEESIRQPIGLIVK